MTGTIDDNAMQMDYGYKWFHVGNMGMVAGVGVAAGAPDMVEIGSSGLCGAAIAVDADQMSWMIPRLGSEIDTAYDILAQVWFSSAGTADTDPVIFGAYAKGLEAADVWSAVESSPDGTITFDSITSVAGVTAEKTDWRGFGVADTFAADDFIMFGAACITGPSGSAEVTDFDLVGLMIKYTRTLHASDGVRKLT